MLERSIFKGIDSQVKIFSFFEILVWRIIENCWFFGCSYVEGGVVELQEHHFAKILSILRSHIFRVGQQNVVIKPSILPNTLQSLRWDLHCELFIENLGPDLFLKNILFLRNLQFLVRVASLDSPTLDSTVIESILISKQLKNWPRLKNQKNTQISSSQLSSFQRCWIDLRPRFRDILVVFWGLIDHFAYFFSCLWILFLRTFLHSSLSIIWLGVRWSKFFWYFVLSTW